jgi:hypothetical protein
MDNTIVISQQTPQQAGITTPKPGEMLWWVVVDDGDNYKPTQLCIANSDKWSSPIDFSALVGGPSSGLTQAQADALYRGLSTAITSADISNGTITNDDISATTLIDWSKINKVGALYRQTFTNANITAGVISITHNLANSDVDVIVYDENNKVIDPDDITATSINITTIDLTSFIPITGTWRVYIR